MLMTSLKYNQAYLRLTRVPCLSAEVNITAFKPEQLSFGDLKNFSVAEVNEIPS